MKILDKIKELTKTSTDVALSEKLGMSLRTVGTWRSRGFVPEKVIREWSIAFGKPIEWFTCEATPYTTKSVYSRICCGDGIAPEGNEIIGEVMVPEKYDKPNIIMVQAKGRSMEPTIKEGAYVGVDINDRDMVSGEMFAVCSDLEGSTIKRIMIESDKLFLVPDNNIWKGVEVTEIPDYFIIGRVRIVVNEY